MESLLSDNGMTHLVHLIDKKHPDYLKIKYYPSNEQNIKDIECSSSLVNYPVIKTATELSPNDMEKLNIFLKSYPCVLESFSEYGIKDTFVRISTNTLNVNKPVQGGTTRMFFKRELHIFEVDNLQGMFVIEMYRICEEESLPHIVNYHYNASYLTTTYNVSVDKSNRYLYIRFTKTKHMIPIDKVTDKVIGSNDPDDSKDIKYTDISRDLDISSLNIGKDICEFIDDVQLLKKELNLVL